jgi:dihydroorotase
VSTRAGIRAARRRVDHGARDIDESRRARATSQYQQRDSVRLVQAKRRGAPVTCEVTPHHLTLTDDAGRHDASQCNPPAHVGGRRGCARRCGRDHRQWRDHARHSPVEKTSSNSRLRHHRARSSCRWSPLVRARTRGAGDPIGSGGAFGLSGTLATGRADVTVIDPDAAWTCDAGLLRSRSRNTPFSGQSLRGRAALTVVGGTIAYSGETLT